MALPLVPAARHNDVKPLLGRELMILTHDDDDVCMYVCHLWSSVVLANWWLVAADVWEVNTEAVFHC